MLSNPSIPAARRLLLLPLLGALSAACLTGSAASPDGGAHADGATGTPDTGSMPHPDATMSVDSGMTPMVDGSSPGSDAGHDGGGVTIPICMDPTGTDTSCNTCTESACASLVGAALAACASFYTCYQGCKCSDAPCIMACEMNAGAACGTPAGNLINCTKSMCATACAPPGVDGGSHDSGPAVDAGATCKNPTKTQIACGKCEESSCASVVANEQSMCGSFNTCFDACDCSDTNCATTCYEEAPKACQTVLGQLKTCQTSTCEGPCSGATTDAGATEGGSTSMQVPDCKSPTPAEQTAYAACSTCDDKSCGTYVNTAVADCTAYYACVADTACSDTTALETCYATKATLACEGAITLLTDCQDTFCAVDCPL